MFVLGLRATDVLGGGAVLRATEVPGGKAVLRPPARCPRRRESFPRGTPSVFPLAFSVPPKDARVARWTVP